MGTTGFACGGTGADAVTGNEAIMNGFDTREAACEVKTFDGAPVHLNVGKAGCAISDNLDAVIALIVPSTTALAAPSAPAAAIVCRRVTALPADAGVCTTTVGCADAVSR